MLPTSIQISADRRAGRDVAHRAEKSA